MRKPGKYINRDLQYLDQALRLATRGAGQVAPNPMVGAVIVNNGYVVGEGFHRYDDASHAEVIALKQAGLLARGGTAYINLEPCCHSGNGKRTPPCVGALIDAKVDRVVCCTKDPNPRVAGRGFAALRAAGIEVMYDMKADEAYRLNAEYFGRMFNGYENLLALSEPARLVVPTHFQAPLLAKELEQAALRSKYLF